MRRDRLSAAVLIGCVAAASLAQATTVVSNTLGPICRAEVTVGDSPDPAAGTRALEGAVAGGNVALVFMPSQGSRVCYRRGVVPNDCASPMSPWVCHPITSDPNDIVDIR